MKVKLFTILAAAVTLAALTPVASAGTITFWVSLDGSQSVPPHTTNASGSAVVVVDDVADSVSVNLSFTGLIGGPAFAAHIHCCAPPSGTAPVVIPFTGFPNATSGTYSNTFVTSPANIAGIEAFDSYINIHNSVFPGGEIRGDLTAANLVPEPGSMTLIGLGLAFVAFGSRRLLRR